MGVWLFVCYYIEYFNCINHFAYFQEKEIVIKIIVRKNIRDNIGRDVTK